MLLAAIDERHRGTYDFIYLPIDFKASDFPVFEVIDNAFYTVIDVVSFVCRTNATWVMHLLT